MIENRLTELREFIKQLAANGGPEPEQYPELYDWFDHIADLKKQGLVTGEAIESLRPLFGTVFQNIDNFQGRTFLKPLGYAGDYLVIDRFYQSSVSENPALKKWDQFVQDMAPAEAVRNRKEYFKNLVDQWIDRKDGQKLQVLNLASGPCRDVLEALQKNSNCPIQIDCVDNDSEAIAYAAELLRGLEDKVELIHRNVLRVNFEKKYDLIWSAGLFDYFKDRMFVAVLSRMSQWLAPGGEIVVGNFSEANPSRHAMEFSEWILEYRSAEKLIGLGQAAGFDSDSIVIEKEPTSVNLFLHIAPSQSTCRDGSTGISQKEKVV